MGEPDPLAALAQIAAELARLKRAFALVGGLGVSVRAEVRFTRDVDLAVRVRDDADAESLARELHAKGYGIVALVEHDEAERLATLRLRSPSGVTVDLLMASSVNPEIDLQRVRTNLRLIEERGFHRKQDLGAKLQSLLDRRGDSDSTS
jgi:hypothetical protein